MGIKTRNEVADKLHERGLKFMDEEEGGKKYLELLKNEALFHKLRKLTNKRASFTVQKFKEFLAENGF